MKDTKECPVCEQEFSRIRNGKKISLTQWKLKTYCSMDCAKKKTRPGPYGKNSKKRA